MLVNSLLETRDHDPASGKRAEVSTDRSEFTPTPLEISLPSKYRYVGRLGRGGMGEVIHAFDNDLQRHVAIKFMRSKAAESALARRRFLDEARILAQLHHPNVVDVFEKGEVDGEPYFVMAYLDGHSLAERREEFRTSAVRVVGVMTAVAAGVQHAHENGVYHRDLKASNVMFDDGRPVVVDFGCARWEDAELSTQGFALLGTPSHMAPEIFEHGSKEHDARADLWSLGVMLYYLLAGELPFASDPRSPEGRAKLLAESPRPIRECKHATPGLDDRLQTIVGKALAKNPAERYQTAAEFAAELEGWTNTPSALVEPKTDAPPHPRRSLKWVAVAGAILALCGGGLVAGFSVNALLKAGSEQSDRPAAERWAAGDPVTLVDDRGTLLEPMTKVDGFVGGVETVADERALSLSSGNVLLLEFDTPWLGRAFRLSADVHHSSENEGSELGLVIAHHQFPRGKHAVFTNTFRAEGLPPGRHRGLPATAFAGGRWVDLTNNRFPLKDYGHELGTADIAPHLFAPAGNPKEYRTLTLISNETEVVAEHDGVEIARVTWREMNNHALQKFFSEGQPAPTPLYGSGIGLIVRNGTGLFRNVRVRPSPPKL